MCEDYDEFTNNASVKVTRVGNGYVLSVHSKVLVFTSWEATIEALKSQLNSKSEGGSK